MNHYLISSLLFIGFGISLFAQNQDVRQEATVPPTIYEVRQQCLDKIDQRYREMSEPPTYLKKVEIHTPTGIEYAEELLLSQGLDPEYEQIREWFDFLEPRLYPSGQFLDASAIMMREIKGIEKNSLNKEKQQGPCNIAAQWQSIGPFVYKTGNLNNQTDATISQTQHRSFIPGVGRVNFIKKHPGNNTLYIGASNGGLWRSTDNGDTWQVLNDKIAVLGTSDLAFDPNNANTMYLVTGDKSRGGAEAIGTTTYSVGVLKSTNGGVTWSDLAPAVKWSQFTDPISQGIYLKINKLIVTANGDLLIGTTDSPITKHVSESGVWKVNITSTTATWDKKLTTTHGTLPNIAASAVSDMLLLPNGKIIVANRDGDLYSSTDGGNTFTPITSPLMPTGSIGRVALAGCLTNAADFYALFVGADGRFERLLKFVNGSTPGFKNIGFVSGVSPAGFFDKGKEHLALTVSPTNDNVVFLAGNQKIYKLTITPSGNFLIADAAAQTVYIRPETSLNLNDEDYVHADVKDFMWANNTTLYVATDGGVARTTDGGATWSKWYELNADLAISECYRIGGFTNNTDVLFTGTHDNGIWRLDKNSANSQWINIKEGDCGEIAPVSPSEVHANYFRDLLITTLIDPDPSADFVWNKSYVNPGYINTNIANFGSNAALLYNNNNLYASHSQLFKKSTNPNGSWGNCIANYYNGLV